MKQKISSNSLANPTFSNYTLSSTVNNSSLPTNFINNKSSEISHPILNLSEQ